MNNKKMKIFYKIRAKIICRRRGHHFFIFSPMSMDNIYEIDILKCACGATQERRWTKQSEAAIKLCDEAGIPYVSKRVLLIEKIFKNNIEDRYLSTRKIFYELKEDLRANNTSLDWYFDGILNDFKKKLENKKI